MTVTKTVIDHSSASSPDMSSQDTITFVGNTIAKWQICAQHQSSLLSSDAPNWYDLEHESSATLLKQGHARKTWRVQTSNQTVIVKVFERDNLFERIKHVFVKDQAQREWDQTVNAQSLGLSVAGGLAIGRSRDDSGRTALIFKYIESSQTLGDAWDETPNHTLIDITARLFAHAHDRGFVHGDAHPSNILILTENPELPRAMWIDVSFSKIHHRADSLEERVRSLARLDHYFKSHATPSQRLRFFHRYIKLASNLGGLANTKHAVRVFIKNIDREEHKHSVRLALHRDRRMKRNSKYFAKCDPAIHYSGRVTVTLERRHAYPEKDVPDRTLSDWKNIFQNVNFDRLDRDDIQQAFASHNIQMDMQRANNFWTKLKWTLGGSPYKKYFYHCHALRHRDLPAPMVLGYLERRSGGLVDSTILLRPQ